MANNVGTLTDTTFDEQVNGATEPILVDFWAEWCGPCKKVAPILAEIADEQVGKISIAKINIDDNPGAAERFGVNSIPTLMVFKDKVQVFAQPGALPRGCRHLLLNHPQVRGLVLAGCELGHRHGQRHVNCSSIRGRRFIRRPHLRRQYSHRPTQLLGGLGPCAE